ncbi:uncharacterized protein HKW66_Vig0002190 [Vigna angularis]|uniref:Transmembrane protein n=2 Tax=Phaseolus angularis TaxID=3914 RepID=A0A8T0LC61_PHAAN|nr:uncharacterized protein LOC108341650 [Vigna angularis]KAG2409554.1 uncharacterized protein HKW66_Vig0002190 [Vigna angularis]BAT74480.1 hypothetical protein VIGAN_01215600 [Vigna angularis var. angularis]
MEHKENIDEWQEIEPSEWNMEVINENYLEVGDQASSTDDPPIPPPTHHELSLSQIVPTTVTDPEDGASSPLTPSTAPLDWRVRVVNEGKKLLRLRLEGMRERVVGIASKVSNWAMYTGAFWSFTHVAGASAAAAVLVSLVYVGIRRRRRRAGRRNVVADHCVFLLKEKDEKISQLLHQIAQLNEVLSSRRKVPVHQIN